MYIYKSAGKISHIAIQIFLRSFHHWIPAYPPAILGIIIAVIVVNQPQFVISVFAGEPERIVLCGISFHPEDIPIWAVFVQGAASRSDAEERRSVFQQVVRAVQVFRPGSRFIKEAHGQDARGHRFQRIPQIGFPQYGHCCFRRNGGVQFHDLQVAVINESFFRHQDFSFIDGFLNPPVQIVIAALHPPVPLNKPCRLVQGIIRNFPFSCGRLNLRLVAVSIIARRERRFFLPGDGRVLVQAVGRVRRR